MARPSAVEASFGPCVLAKDSGEETRMKTVQSPLWEILVPHKMGEHDNANPDLPKRNHTIPVPYHQQWDEYVRGVTGGLTIHRAARGQWEDGDGKLYKEIMIPVRIACTEDQIKQIAEFSLDFYKQKAIFVTLVSEKTLVFYADGEEPKSDPDEIVGLALYYTEFNGIGGMAEDVSNENLIYLKNESSSNTQFIPLYQCDLDRREKDSDNNAVRDSELFADDHIMELLDRHRVDIIVDKIAQLVPIN